MIILEFYKSMIILKFYKCLIISLLTYDRITLHTEALYMLNSFLHVVRNT